MRRATRNPILSERLTGMSRLLRGYALSGMENQALWHERDISHSSVERVVLPKVLVKVRVFRSRASSCAVLPPAGTLLCRKLVVQRTLT